MHLPVLAPRISHDTASDCDTTNTSFSSWKNQKGDAKHHSHPINLRVSTSLSGCNLSKNRELFDVKHCSLSIRRVPYHNCPLSRNPKLASVTVVATVNSKSAPFHLKTHSPLPPMHINQSSSSANSLSFAANICLILSASLARAALLSVLDLSSQLGSREPN